MSSSSDEEDTIDMPAGKKVQMNWNDQMVLIFLNLVIVKGCHIAQYVSSKEAALKWGDLLEDLFKNREFIPLKKDHYFSGNVRFLKDKLTSLISKANRSMAHGNKSAFKGDKLSEDFKLIKQIIDDKDDAKELREETKELKGDLASTKVRNEQTILNKKLKKKNEPTGKQADGTIITKSVKDSSSATPAKKKVSVEDVMMATLINDWEKRNPTEASGASVTSKIINKANSIEEDVQEQMIEWCGLMNKTIDVFCDEASVKYCSPVHSINVELMVAAFCIPGADFSMKSFKENMMDMDVPKADVLKCFFQMQKWKKESVKWLRTVELSTSNVENMAGLDDSFESNATPAFDFDLEQPVFVAAANVEPVPVAATKPPAPVPLVGNDNVCVPVPLVGNDNVCVPVPLVGNDNVCVPVPLVGNDNVCVPVPLVDNDNVCVPVQPDKRVVAPSLPVPKPFPNKRRVEELVSPPLKHSRAARAKAGALSLCHCGCGGTGETRYMRPGCDKCVDRDMKRYVLPSCYSNYRCLCGSS